MKVLYITEIFPDPRTGLGYWGGGERQFYEVATRVAKMGHEVTVLTCKFPGQRDHDIYDGVEVKRAGASRDPRTGEALKSPVRVAEYLARTVKNGLDTECDVIHCNAYFPVVAGWVVSAIKGAPMISTFHDLPGMETWTEYSGSRTWGLLGYLSTVSSALLARGPVISVSEVTKRKLAPYVRGALDVIPNGVDLALLDPARSRRRPAQVLYVGRLVRYKRVDVLLSAFGEVLSKMPEATLVIVGGGKERPLLEKLAASLPRESVTFMGSLASNEEVAKMYRESTLFVLPSVVEGEGIVLKEAMAAGLPVIATRSPGSGVLGLVKEGWNGALVRPDDPGPLATTILQFLSDKGRREETGMNGRKMAETWDWDETAKGVLRIYRRALAKR
ncbi:MAG: glycosyltransferase family 4 protein [Nitrososphaerota archaeon]|nr:glycosyltransferase family 4 protein [Nitrososphaerota archaeon]MDG6956688.1 glycosyltransferase family 4 protein [Nitrososphaerota archaeon]MDG6965941.1 glycosyltransferase family 4 protein [Nitrososphaerota archaeon]MDG6968914.1 glycosyltransferase family 4 protein [Nitrososphaerota archaeon]MDG6973250.1 glycosyltransferase family 4 protein [Nitrososphaerota archaeon]